MASSSLNEHFRTAAFERISRYTVGIAVDRNRGVGTGTLVASNGCRYILTAAHVIEDFPPEALRFWLRPGPMREKAAADTTAKDVGGYTAGAALPIVEIIRNNESDIAVLRLDDSFRLPAEADCYDVSNSHEFLDWPEDRIEGLSLFVFGFPTDNSHFIYSHGENAFRFIGCATFVCDYSTAFSGSKLKRLSSPISPEKDFVFEYTGCQLGIGPAGFSGSGVWVIPDDQTKMVWSPDPLLIGVVHRYVKKFESIAAAKLSAFLASS